MQSRKIVLFECELNLKMVDLNYNSEGNSNTLYTGRNYIFCGRK